jgi:ABC-type glycerol-3-phosphate transport system substrate-binding protein
MPYRPLSRRDFLRLAGLTGAGLAVSACQPGLFQQTTPTGQKVQLVYQDSTQQWFLPMVQEMLGQFHAEHPDIQVFYTPEPENPENIEKHTLELMRAGAAPDVFAGCCSWLPIWAQEGHTLDLRPFIEEGLDADTLADWDPAHFKAHQKSNGEQYALPAWQGGLGLYYNKDIFDTYKVDYPDGSWDHDDYLAAMKLLAHDRDGDGKIDLWGSAFYITWDRIQIHINGWGGHLVDPQNPKKMLLAAPEALAAQEWLRARIWDDHVMPSPLDVQNRWPDDVFIAGELAMVEDGSWRLKNILTNAKFRVGVAPFPAGPVRRATLASTNGYSIYRGTQHPEAAWELLKFLTGKDFGRAMARANFMQPARMSLLQDWIGFVRAEFPESAAEMDLAAFADGHLKGYSVVSETPADMAVAKDVTDRAWEQIYIFGAAPVDILSAAAAEIEASQ